eukprot:CAMPEP_0174357532 /NCGR_PEP_ID=MMETSP0811_2-20130205/36596_1 /TAXON_ID=73025 ORGANISM="Eutreptiella gymnastica-like, Strain CCMP1594" /NCGR_SAMPLE_ID=MMETSP0811_2 /ASSEMBLY_ACC=CAM_ASM_000667 /LENGTH=212 /DNA_ID=CAMNT_0015490433 /DNA_START=1704 /DNA_END=2339 /DNA_ORIENTATION=+
MMMIALQFGDAHPLPSPDMPPCTVPDVALSDLASLIKQGSKLIIDAGAMRALPVQLVTSLARVELTHLLQSLLAHDVPLSRLLHGDRVVPHPIAGGAPGQKVALPEPDLESFADVRKLDHRVVRPHVVHGPVGASGGQFAIRRDHDAAAGRSPVEQRDLVLRLPRIHHLHVTAHRPQPPPHFAEHRVHAERKVAVGHRVGLGRWACGIAALA